MACGSEALSHSESVIVNSFGTSVPILPSTSRHAISLQSGSRRRIRLAAFAASNDSGSNDPPNQYRTHGHPVAGLPLEDLLALADAVWKTHRPWELESLVTRRIGSLLVDPLCEVFLVLDDRLAAIAARGPERLAWQTGQ